jgi:hypothetical protein
MVSFSRLEFGIINIQRHHHYYHHQQHHHKLVSACNTDTAYIDHTNPRTYSYLDTEVLGFCYQTFWPFHLHHFHVIDIIYFKFLSLPSRHHVSCDRSVVITFLPSTGMRIFFINSEHSDPHQSVGNCKKLQAFIGAPFGISITAPSVAL